MLTLATRFDPVTETRLVLRMGGSATTYCFGSDYKNCHLDKHLIISNMITNERQNV